MTFDFQADLERYCVSNVDSLRRCCGCFSSMFMEHTSVNPFYKSFTIASVCNKVYRTLFLQADLIGIIPLQGYGTDNQSTIALSWMDWFAQWEGCCVRHAFNGREQRVEGFKVDGMTEDGTIL